VRFDPEVAWWARRQVAPGTPVTDEPDGTLTVTLKVGAADALIGWLIGFEDKAEVVAPPALRRRFVDHIRGAA
jgi:predicted DNA-binding transcriptional regulator YafY